MLVEATLEIVRDPCIERAVTALDYIDTVHEAAITEPA